MSKETYPKITAKTKIKSYEFLKDGIKIKFDGLTLPQSCKDTLENFIENEEEVRVTIQQIQGRLPVKSSE